MNTYKDYIKKNYDIDENLSLNDFIEICDKLNYSVIENETIIYPFCLKNLVEYIAPKKYKNMSEYRKNAMPDWSARYYDYISDKPTSWKTYDDIRNGEFEITDSNSSSNYYWKFTVKENFVDVTKKFYFID